MGNVSCLFHPKSLLAHPHLQHHHLSDTRIPPMLIPSAIVWFDYPRLHPGPMSCSLRPADHQIVYFASSGLVWG